jgi:Na+-translocating ferredoxin:NAD+ oxidoreductase RNF subunit RnfB
MDSEILLNVFILGGTAFIAAFVLYFVSKKFMVEVDETTVKIASILPQANCGACGRAGCSDFAAACAKADADSFSTFYCPVGGRAVMQQIAAVKGFQVAEKAKSTAILRCQGSCQNAPEKVHYEAVSSCRIANRISAGISGCPDGCLHLGDCVKACAFGALTFDKQSGLPVVDSSKCVSCGACVKVCPRGLFEIRTLTDDGQMVYVACRNRQKGAVARKNCAKACIGCMKCAKINEMIKVENNLSYIPQEVDATRFGAELAQNCPTGAIVYQNKEKQVD